MPSGKKQRGARRPAKKNGRKAKQKNGSGFSGAVKQGTSALSTLFRLGKTAFRTITGRGDYTIDHPIKENSILKPLSFESIKEATPEMAAGGIRVQHREFLGDLSSGTAADPQFSQWVVNPADARTFPYLSNIAANFEQYMLMGLVFEYVSTSGNAVASQNSALGSLTFAAQYNVNNITFGSRKRDIANHFWAVSGKPSMHMTMPIECANGASIKPLFIRNAAAFGEVAPGALLSALAAAEVADARLYDHCRLEYLAIGSQALFTGGELWVTYDVVLMKPRLARTTAAYTFKAPADLDEEKAPADPIEVDEVQRVLLNKYQGPP